MLLEANVLFDIAIVDYNIRSSSKDEVAYANDLAIKFNKKIFIKSVLLESANFESQARAVRYKFFEDVISSGGYDSLITAHQLNDKVEWMLMSFCRGSGLSSMSGMDEFEIRDGFMLARPMLNIAKQHITDYLERHQIKYFRDETNSDESYTRNYFRANFANELVSKYENGIKKSFSILSSEKRTLYPQIRFFLQQELLVSKPIDDHELLYYFDASLKRVGYIASMDQKKEFLKSKNAVVGGKYAAVFDGKMLFVSPFVECKLEKQFKEECRVAKVPAKIRGYLLSVSLFPMLIRSGVDRFFCI